MIGGRAPSGPLLTMVAALALLLACLAPAIAAPSAAPRVTIAAPPPLVHDAQYVGARTTLPDSHRWLVVASRPNYDTAVRFARSFSNTVAPCVVVRSSNGWFAILAGVLDMPKGEANLANLKGARLVPQDSYLSSGRRFSTVVWSGYSTPGYNDVMDQRAVRSTVRRMQSALRDAGFYSDAVDGLLGKRTVRAYQAYERESGTARSWGESYLGATELARMEGYAGQRRTMLAQRRARADERRRTAAMEREREERRALERQLASGEWQSLDEMARGEAAGFASGRDYREARRQGIASPSVYAEFRASDFRSGSVFLDARGRGFATRRALQAANAGGWRTADEMVAGLGEGFETGDDYRTARRGGFVTATQFADAKARGFTTLSAMERAEAGDHRTASEMAAARAGDFDTGGAYRDARDRGFDHRTERDAAGKAGYRTAKPFRLAREAGFATKVEADDARARGFTTAAARDAAAEAGFTVAAAYDDARRHGWRDASELERGRRMGFVQGEAFRAAKLGSFSDAKSFEAAAARGFASRRSVMEADRLGYRTAAELKRGTEGGFTGGDEYREASAAGYFARAEWLRGQAGGFGNARDLAAADRGGYRTAAELTAGRDGGFADAKAYRAASEAGFPNAAEVARAAALGYRTAPEMAAGEDGGFRDAAAYRAAAERGFARRSEMMHAASAGFDTAADRDAARERGFATMAALEEAEGAGFDRADDYAAFRASGFDAREGFLRARQRGHVTRAAALEDAIGRLDVARTTATDALSDAELFIRRSPLMPDLMEVVGVVGELTGSLGAQTDRADLDAVEADLAGLDRGRERLLQSLGRDAGFAAFHAQRMDERESERTRRRAAARADLETLRSATTAWIAANLLHPGAQQMVGLMDEVETALATGDAGAMEGVAETVRVAALGHGATIDRAGRALAAREGADDAPFTPDMLLGGADDVPGDLPPGVDPVETGSIASSAGAAGRAATIAVTDANRFLVEGDADGVVGLYNPGRDEPNVVIDILGDVVFLDGRASACTIGVTGEGAEARHLRAVLRDAGVERLEALRECTPAALDRVDLVVARRGDFRVGTDTRLVDRVLRGVESASLRRFDPVTTASLDAAATGERVLLDAIAADLAAGGRAGFGAVALGEGGDGSRGPFCVATDDAALHAGLIAAEPVAAGRIGATPVPTTLRDAYLASQRGGCATVYASGDDLATLLTALSRDGREHELLPFWIDEATVSAEAGTRRTAALAAERGAAERAREREAQAAIAARMAREANETLAARTSALREEHGTQARGLAGRIDAMLDDMIAGCRECEARGGDVAAEQFPDLATWHAARTRGDDWTIEDVSHEIAEYGDARHNGRAIRAIALRVDFDLASAGRGEKRRECLALGAAWDDEFGRWRDPFVGGCDDGSVDAWARGYALDSLWTAREPSPPSETAAR